MPLRERAASSRDPKEEERGWLKRPSDIDRQKGRLLDLHLDEKLDKGQHESKARDLNRATETAESELERLRNRQSRIGELERDRDVLSNSYARIVPEQPDATLPEERHRVYKMLNLSVTGHRDGGRDHLGLGGSFSGSW